MKGPWWWWALPALALISGCDRGDEGAGPEDGQTAGKADDVRICPETAPAYRDPGEGANAQARRDALQAYADALMLAKTCELEDLFAGEGLSAVAALEDAYALTVGPDGCLDDALGSDGKHEELITYVESTVQFMRTFHEDMDGVATGLFHTVQLCPEGTYGEDLQLTVEDKTLGVGVSFSTLGFGGAPQDGEKIRKWWTDGKQIDHRDDVKAWNDEFWFDGTDDLWTVLDPVGHARLSLRNTLGDAGVAVATKLEGMDEASEVTEAKLAQLIRDEVSGSSGHRNVRACALGYIQGKKSEELALFATSWRAALMAPSFWNAMAETLVAQSQPPTSIADRAVAQECGTMDFGEIELPHIAVRTFLGDYVDLLDTYLTTYAGENTYADGSASCWFEIEGENVVVSADMAVPTGSIDYVLSSLEVDCDAVAIDEPDPEPEPDPDDPEPDPDPDPDDPEPDPDDPEPDPDDPEPDPDDPDNPDDPDPEDPDDPDDPDGDPDPDPGDGDGDADDEDPWDDDADDEDPWGDDNDDSDDDYDPLGDDNSPSPWDEEDGDPEEGADEDAARGGEGGCRIGGAPDRTGALALLLLGILGLRRRRA